MSARGTKRARTSGVRVARPIDKELIAVNLSVTTTQMDTVLKTTTFPGTVVGLRWSMSARSVVTAAQRVDWAIVTTEDGNTVNNIGTSNAGDFYTPEQNVLAFGSMQLEASNSTAGPSNFMWEGSTKTMRKLKQGDTLEFTIISTNATGASIDGVVQFFFKT